MSLANVWSSFKSTVKGVEAVAIDAAGLGMREAGGDAVSGGKFSGEAINHD